MHRGSTIHLACGDSLLHGSPGGDQRSIGWAPTDHVYQPEDRDALSDCFGPKTYHAVVANPPYITPKDRALNQAYRDRYSHLPQAVFTGRALPGTDCLARVEGGFTGQITANSFMKREFGKKLIEEFFPESISPTSSTRAGLTSRATARRRSFFSFETRSPLRACLRTVMGIRGEPATPDDAFEGTCLVRDRCSDRPTRFSERICERQGIHHASCSTSIPGRLAGAGRLS